MAEKRAKEKQMSEWEKLEKEFEEVLTELIADETLEKFRGEYEKLHTALVNSHDSERKLIDKVRQLNAEIQDNAGKVASAVKMSQEDRSTIASLRKDVDNAWKMVEHGREKELVARDTIQALKQEIDKLTSLVEKGAGIPPDLKQQEVRESQPAAEKQKSEEVKETQEEQTGEVKDDGERQRLMLYQAEVELRSKAAELQRERIRCKKLEVCR